jgi:hypothetical protein
LATQVTADFFPPHPTLQVKEKGKKFLPNFGKIFIGQGNSRKSGRSLPKRVCE